MPAQRPPDESGEEEYFTPSTQDFTRSGVGGSVGGDTTTASTTVTNTDDEEEDDGADTASMAPPQHPVPSMQGAFEESIHESSQPNPRRKSTSANAEERRQRVLEDQHYDDSWTRRWKQSHGARHHPLAKLMAQIVFGMHLLQQQAAKSDEEVVKILQTHVDEVDSFLEKTTEDFDLAVKDIEERIRYLKLPMSHVEVFGTMLEDKQFRSQLLDGNDKIENIIERTSRAMNAALLDIHKGKTSTKELEQYLHSVEDEWPGEKADLEDVLTAMRGNQEGWKFCFRDLQKKGTQLRDLLDHLTTVIGEMSRMAAEASRRARANNRASSGQHLSSSAIPRSKFNSSAAAVQRPRGLSVDKPLPKAPSPSAMDGPVELEAHPIPIERRYEQPRATPASPTLNEQTSKASKRSSTVPPRPSTSRSNMEARDDRQVGRNETAELAEFLRDGRPPSASLRSNLSSGGSAATPQNSKRMSAIDVVDHAKNMSRPQTSESQRTSSLPFRRRGSEPLEVAKPVRQGIERNKHGPPPAREQRESRRRGSSIGPFVRRLSFRKPREESPNRSARDNPPSTTTRRPSVIASSLAAAFTSKQPQPQPPSTSTSTPTQKNLPPPASATTRKTPSPTDSKHHQQPPIALPPCSPATNTTSTTTTLPNPSSSSPSISQSSRTTPGKESLIKAESRSTPSPVANGGGGGGGGVGGGGWGASKPPAAAVVNVKDDKKRGRGLSLRKFFGAGSKQPTRERVPRAAMTYGDLA
ncbi:hypothetical protein Q7P37_008362 [Cladosporium fusiforme]